MNLENLWVNDNKLSAITGLDANFRIKALYAQNNGICTLRGSLRRFTFLETLDLSNNQARARGARRRRCRAEGARRAGSRDSARCRGGRAALPSLLSRLSAPFPASAARPFFIVTQTFETPLNTPPKPLLQKQPQINPSKPSRPPQIRNLDKTLAFLKSHFNFLRILDLSGNPVCEEPDYRTLVIQALPQARVARALG